MSVWPTRVKLVVIDIDMMDYYSFMGNKDDQKNVLCVAGVCRT